MNEPRKIRHINYERSDNLLEIAEDCAAALHMSKGEAALLKYYAKCSDGFQPAAILIAEKTKQSRRQVFRNRAALVAHGVIAESGDDIIVDWQRAKTFASLDPKMTKGEDTWTAMLLPPHKPYLTVLEWHTLPMRVLLQTLSSMTEQEYNSLSERLKKEVKQSEGCLRECS